MQKTLTLPFLFMLLLSISSAQAQVHGSGGLPGSPKEEEAYCHGKLGDAQELEKDYLKSRGIPHKNDQSFFKELHQLVAQNVIRAVNASGLSRSSCGTQPLPHHTAEQIQMLKDIQSIWKEADQVRNHCRTLFRTRSRMIDELDCVIRSLTPKADVTPK